MLSDASDSRVRVVLVTVPSMEAGRTLASRLVEEGIAACGNLLPGVVSIFRWEDEVQEEDEVLLVLKTTGERLPDLFRRVPELHPYDVPEVLSLPVDVGHEPYLNWVIRSVSGPQPRVETDDAPNGA